MSDDLVAFLRARWDEEEALAKACEGDAWLFDTGYFASEEVTRGLGDNELRHITRHDPAQVLREVEAKRQILYWLDAADDKSIHIDAWALAGQILREMIRVYADHPDYRDEWRP